MAYSNIDNMTSDELKQWRKINGYSQGQLAKALGVIPLTVSRWERGAREIPPFLQLALNGLVLSVTKATIHKKEEEDMKTLNLTGNLRYSWGYMKEPLEESDKQSVNSCLLKTTNTKTNLLIIYSDSDGEYIIDATSKDNFNFEGNYKGPHEKNDNGTIALRHYSHDMKHLFYGDWTLKGGKQNGRYIIELKEIDET